MVKPIVLRVGTKHTSIANIDDVANSCRRSKAMLTEYILLKLGTTIKYSDDVPNGLTFGGRFMPKQIENVLRDFIVECVRCKVCLSYDTDKDGKCKCQNV